MARSAKIPVLELEEHPTAEFRAAVLAGLAQRQKQIPSKFFYDAEGSRLFDQICLLPEYYPTRTETAILRANADGIADSLPAEAVLVEYGSGASIKIRILLDGLTRPSGYVPIDISRDHLRDAARALAIDYPHLAIRPVCGDFALPLSLPRDMPSGPRVGFFPGSTIGNLHPADAVQLLARFAGHLGPGGWLLIGVDLKKDIRLLHAAYNDAAGITAAFNRNLLVRINRELNGNFDIDSFDHSAFWNVEAGRIEMHLVSAITQTARVAGRSFGFAAGESIHTENSYKYTDDEFRRLAVKAGFQPVTVWSDGDRLFSVHLLSVAGR
jgi:dimethylhistidine N-methyltransferase